MQSFSSTNKVDQLGFSIRGFEMRGSAMTIWVNEQIDPMGLVYSCIASCNENQAKDCHESFKQNLTEGQKAAGWVARLRTVNSWDEVPVNALKLD